MRLPVLRWDCELVLQGATVGGCQRAAAVGIRAPYGKTDLQNCQGRLASHTHWIELLPTRKYIENFRDFFFHLHKKIQAGPILFLCSWISHGNQWEFWLNKQRDSGHSLQPIHALDSVVSYNQNPKLNLQALVMTADNKCASGRAQADSAPCEHGCWFCLS